jgi:hypothetical protein
VGPFGDEEIAGTEPLYYTYREEVSMRYWKEAVALYLSIT